MVNCILGFTAFFIELQLTKTLILNHLLALQKYDV